MDLNQEWCLTEFKELELQTSYCLLEEFGSFYDEIANGHMETVQEICEKIVNKVPPEGVFSTDRMRDRRYHFAIISTEIAKRCIEKGLSKNKSFYLNRFFIQKMDKITSVEEIDKLFVTMVHAFCQEMIEFKKDNSYSKPIVLCIDYIYSHLHSRITVRELSEHLNLSESYLSKLFHKEVGITISEYITRLKIEKAKNMLQYSDFSIIDIANYLSFSSQSHFIQVFQKNIGLTPHKYRTKNFRTAWK